MKNKLTLWIGIIGLVLVFSIAGVYTLVQQTALPSSAFIQAPIFGFVECLPNYEKNINLGYITFENSPHKISQNEVTWYYLSCDDWGENNGCTITLKIPQEGLSVGERALSYVKGDVLDLNSQITVEKGPLSSQEYTTEIQLKDDESLFFSYQTVSFVLGNKNRIGGTFKVKMTPFALFVTDVMKGGKERLESTSETNCIVSSSIKNGFISSTTISELTGKKGVPNYLNKGEIYNYITSFVSVPAFAAGTNELNAYCLNDKLYKIETVTFAGNEYKVVNTNYNDKIKDVDCCDLDSKPGSICQNNKWVSVEKQQCSITQPCAGGSEWTIDKTKEKTVVIYNCVSNKCLPTYKTVKCTSNSDCSQGYVCYANFDTPDNNKCELIEPNPIPPSVPFITQDTNYLLYVVIGIFALLFILLIALPKKPQKPIK